MTFKPDGVIQPCATSSDPKSFLHPINTITRVEYKVQKAQCCFWSVRSVLEFAAIGAGTTERERPGVPAAPCVSEWPTNKGLHAQSSAEQGMNEERWTDLGCLPICHMRYLYMIRKGNPPCDRLEWSTSQSLTVSQTIYTQD